MNDETSHPYDSIDAIFPLVCVLVGIVIGVVIGVFNCN